LTGAPINQLNPMVALSASKRWTILAHSPAGLRPPWRSFGVRHAGRPVRPWAPRPAGRDDAVGQVDVERGQVGVEVGR
jgi:hypothetical protein